MFYRSVYFRQGVLALLSLAALVAASLFILRSCESNAQKVGESLGQGIETALRDSIKAELDIDPRYHEIHSKELDAALLTVKKRLVGGMNPPPPWDIEIVVVRNNELNAITLPGGIIMVYSGLIRRADSAEEIAAVLAHELGHVAHSDIMKSLGRSLAMNAVLAAGGSVSPTVLNDIMQTLGENAFSRQAEDSADAYAVQLLAATGLRPSSLASVFKKLDPDDKKSKPDLLSWLGTHPDTKSRIKHAEDADKTTTSPLKPLDIDWKAVVATIP